VAPSSSWPPASLPSRSFLPRNPSLIYPVSVSLVKKQVTEIIRPYWEEDSEDHKFDPTQLVQDQALLYGELPPEMNEILSEVFIQDIFEGDITLPGFRRHRESIRSKKWLEWIVPSSS
jgi:hypothetical protein